MTTMEYSKIEAAVKDARETGEIAGSYMSKGEKWIGDMLVGDYEYLLQEHGEVTKEMIRAYHEGARAQEK